MTKKSSSWLDRQRKDPYCKKAKREGYLSRAVFKLQAIDQKYQVFFRKANVLELGAAPGSWTQWVATQINGRYVACDLLDFNAPKEVDVLKGDFLSDTFQEELFQLSDESFDILLSDMAPNFSGISSIDQANVLDLCESVFLILDSVLSAKGTFVMKFFEGEGIAEWIKKVKGRFESFAIFKPEASRKASSEKYIIAKGFKRHNISV